MLENFLREYNVNRIWLSTLGLWPYQNKLVRGILWTFCFFLEISSYPFQILLLHDHPNDVQLIFDVCYQFLLLNFCVAKLLKDLVNYDKMRWMYEAIDEHWNIFTDNIEIRIMKEYSMLSRQFMIYFSILVLSTMLALTIISVTPIFLDLIMPLNETRPLYLAVELEFRVNKADYFLPIFCYTTLVIVVASCITIAVDTTHIACTTHACSLFAAISKQIENIMLKANNNNNDVSKSKYGINDQLDLCVLNEEMIYQEYIICLKKYQLAIEFVNILNSAYQGCALVILIISVAVLCLLGLRIVYVLDKLGILIKHVFLFTSVLFTLMITCYSSQRIIDESWNIFYGAQYGTYAILYAAEWYKFSPRLKSLLIITLYRSNIPCGLKAGNMVPLSIATYAMVLRMSMSYFTALLSVQN